MTLCIKCNLSIHSNTPEKSCVTPGKVIVNKQLNNYNHNPPDSISNKTTPLKKFNVPNDNNNNLQLHTEGYNSQLSQLSQLSPCNKKLGGFTQDLFGDKHSQSELLSQCSLAMEI